MTYRALTDDVEPAATVAETSLPWKRPIEPTDVPLQSTVGRALSIGRSVEHTGSQSKISLIRDDEDLQVSALEDRGVGNEGFDDVEEDDGKKRKTQTSRL